MDFQLFSLQGAFVLAAFFFGAMVDAISGGGGLITIPVLLSIGLSPQVAAATNQSSMILGSATAIYKFNSDKKIYWRCSLYTLPFTILGSVLGSKANMAIPPDIMKSIMIGLVPVIAIVTFIKKDFGSEDRSGTLSHRDLFIRCACIGLIMGTYQAFVAIGTGTFYLLLYCVLDKLDMIKATGTTKPVVFGANIAATITYALSGKVLWTLAAACTVVYILGSYVGSALAVKKGAKIIKPFFFAVLAGIFVKVIVDLFA